MKMDDELADNYEADWQSAHPLGSRWSDRRDRTRGHGDNRCKCYNKPRELHTDTWCTNLVSILTSSRCHLALFQPVYLLVALLVANLVVPRLARVYLAARGADFVHPLFPDR